MKTIAKCENTGEPLPYCAGPFLSLVERKLRPTEAVSVTTGLVNSDAWQSLKVWTPGDGNGTLKSDRHRNDWSL